MFVSTDILDNIEIKSSSQDKTQSVIDQINKKYINKISEEYGLGIYLEEILEIKEYKIFGKVLTAEVSFRMIFNRFYYDEICTGKIVAQDESGIIVENFLLKKNEIISSDLFPNCEFDNENFDGCWVWNYKNNRMVFKNGQEVRFRIKSFRFEDMTVEAMMNDQGLGPIVWWE